MALTQSAVTSTITFTLSTSSTARTSAPVTSSLRFGLNVSTLTPFHGASSSIAFAGYAAYAGYALLSRADNQELRVHFIKADAFTSVSTEQRGGSLVVIGRALPVPLWSAPGGFDGTFGIATETDEQALAVRNLFSIGAPMQMKTCPLAYLAGIWFRPKAFVETKLPYSIWSPYRVFRVDFEQCDSPA